MFPSPVKKERGIEEVVVEKAHKFEEKVADRIDVLAPKIINFVIQGPIKWNEINQQGTLIFLLLALTIVFTRPDFVNVNQNKLNNITL